MPIVNIDVKIEGGEFFATVHKVMSALIEAGADKEALDFFEEAVKDDYDQMLQTCHKYVNVVLWE